MAINSRNPVGRRPALSGDNSGTIQAGPATVNITVLDAEHYFPADSTAGVITYELPVAATFAAGTTITVCKVAGGANAVTVNAAAGETFFAPASGIASVTFTADLNAIIFTAQKNATNNYWEVRGQVA